MAAQLPTLDRIPVFGKRVLVRVDFNVPMKNGAIKDVTRIEAHLPTINYLQKRECKIILMSHLGRPKGKPTPEFSLEPVGAKLQEILGSTSEVIFSDDCISEANKEIARALKKNQVLLLENLRFYSEEEKNDLEFAKQLGACAEVYINDAFGTCHRAHASTAGIASFFDKDHRAAGLLLQKELEAMSPVLDQPRRPLTALLGGAKVSDKLEVIESFIQRADNVLIGGAMAYTFLKARGQKVGKSLVENDKLDLAHRLMDTAEARQVNLLLPEDHVITDNPQAPTTTEVAAQIPDGMAGVDIGPKTIQRYAEAIRTSKTIVWNGPMGIFEMEPFSKGTLAMAKSIAEATQKGQLHSIVGGGDSISALNKSGLAHEITHVSTGGGATLEFFEGKTLPGVKALMS